MRTRGASGFNGGQEDKAFFVDRDGLRSIRPCEAETLSTGHSEVSCGNGELQVLNPQSRNPGDTRHMQVLVSNPSRCFCRQIDLNTGGEINFEGRAAMTILQDWYRFGPDSLRIFSVQGENGCETEIYVIENYPVLQD